MDNIERAVKIIIKTIKFFHYDSLNELPLQFGKCLLQMSSLKIHLPNQILEQFFTRNSIQINALKFPGKCLLSSTITLQNSVFFLLLRSFSYAFHFLVYFFKRISFLNYDGVHTQQHADEKLRNSFFFFLIFIIWV